MSAVPFIHAVSAHYSRNGPCRARESEKRSCDNALRISRMKPRLYLHFSTLQPFYMPLLSPANVAGIKSLYHSLFIADFFDGPFQWAIFSGVRQKTRQLLLPVNLTR